MMYLIAHRGGYKDTKEKENSIESIKKILKEKEIKGVEIDIRMTKDKIFILHHNATIRGKNKTYFIANEEYKKLNEIYQEKEKKKLATLNDVLKIMPKNKVLIIEIKKNNHDEMIAELNQIIKKYKTKKVIVISFFIKYLRLIKIMNNQIETGILLNKISYLLDFKYFYNVYINKNINLVCMDKNMLTYNKARKVLKSSKSLNIFTINNKEEYEQVKKVLKNLYDKYNHKIYITTETKKIVEEEIYEKEKS